MRNSLALFVALLAACANSPTEDAAAAGTDAVSADIAAGRLMAEQQCGACHAVGRAGQSFIPEAPTFRRLSAQYPGASLTDILSEGIATGHPSMPRWIFTDKEVGQLEAYIRSLPRDEAGH